MMNVLLEANYMQAAHLCNPATRRKGLYMTDEDQRAFRSKFTTLKMLSSGKGVENRELPQKLRDLGVIQFHTNDKEFEQIYFISDIQRVQLKIDTADRNRDSANPDVNDRPMAAVHTKPI